MFLKTVSVANIITYYFLTLNHNIKSKLKLKTVIIIIWLVLRLSPVADINKILIFFVLS